MNFNLTYNGTVYGFTRDHLGNGFWYCVKGKVPGVLGKGSPGMMVPSMLSTELSKEAVRQGLAGFKDLSRQMRKEKKTKEKVVRVASTKSTKKKTDMLSSFNPFSLENSVKSEAQVEIEQALEKLKTPAKKKVVDEEETTTLFADLFTTDDEQEEDLDEEDDNIEFDFEEIEEEIIDFTREART